MKEGCDTFCFLINPSPVYRAKISMEDWAGVPRVPAGLSNKTPDDGREKKASSKEILV